MAGNRASEDQLDDLHGEVATTFVDEIRRYKAGEVRDKDGNVLPIPSALLAQAAKFLKDNGVDRAVRAGDPLDLLDDELPELKEYEHG